MQFDPTTRRLRLDPDAVLRLTEAARRAAGGTDARLAPDDPLVVVGAVAPDGTPADALRPALQAILWPVATGDAVVAEASRAFYHQVWVSPTAVAVLADLGGPDHGPGSESYDLLTGLPEHLPSLLATLTGLGPRGPLEQEPPTGVATVPAAVWDALLDVESDDRRPASRALANALAGAWPQVAAAVDTGAWRAWVTGLEGAGGAGAVLVLDTDAGAALGGLADDAVELRGVRRGDVWVAMSGLLAAASG